MAKLKKKKKTTKKTKKIKKKRNDGLQSSNKNKIFINII